MTSKTDKRKVANYFPVAVEEAVKVAEELVVVVVVVVESQGTTKELQ